MQKFSSLNLPANRRVSTTFYINSLPKEIKKLASALVTALYPDEEKLLYLPR